ncbi:unnamed protein product, partial [Pleuronectes platessa]
SNKFTQRRGTAPIRPGKEEQEEGDERECQEEGRRGERERERERREGKGRASSGQGSSPAPPYGPAGP